MVISFKEHWQLSGHGSCLSTEGLVGPFLSADGGLEKYESELGSYQEKNEIVDFLLKAKGAWAVVYHRPDLEKLFVGRDAFGRYSLVWSKDDLGITVACSVRSGLTAFEWADVPFGQVTAICTRSLSAEMFSLLEEYPENADEGWRKAFLQCEMRHKPLRSGLFRLSRSNEEFPTTCDPSKELKERLEDCCRKMVPEDASSVAVAFSGGVDSLLVAYSVLAAVPATTTVYLVNVAFGVDEKSCNEAPDRIRALAAWSQLCSSPIKLHLVLCNVGPQELESCRKEYIAEAAAPALSVLDDSLSCVLWFALRANGIDIATGESVSCPSEVFFVGSGADELFAGYARHRTRCERDGMDHVAEECEKELCRLGNRNGGRDGRVAKQLQRRLAAPFLDDDLVEWANSLPIRWKCDLTLPRGKGEKQIIRKCLRRLGAPHDAPKQAMQFGSRMAKMSNTSKATKGSDVSSHLLEKAGRSAKHSE